MHAMLHCPFVQSATSFAAVAGQGVVHEPQWLTSVLTSTHSPPQSVSGQLHWPPWQSVPCPHARPQDPQFWLSAVRSAQNAAPLVPHTTCPAFGHETHAPRLQSWFAVQTWSHVPQWFRSVPGSMH